MAFKNTAVSKMIREDLEKTQGGYEIVQASLFERMGVKKVPPSELHVNPNDEFSDPEIGPNDSIVTFRSLPVPDPGCGAGDRVLQRIPSDPVYLPEGTAGFHRRREDQ